MTLAPLSGMTQVTTLSGLFYDCRSLTEIDLAPLSGMTQVTNLFGMFYDCRSLTEIDLTPLSKVLPKANVTSMFIGSRSSLEKVVFPAHEGTSDKTFKFFNAFSEANANTAGSTSFTWAAGSEAVTLYRVYGQVRFDAVGGSSENETRYYTAGDTWEIQDASRSGYLFGGWVKADGTFVGQRSELPKDGSDTTLYAVWLNDSAVSEVTYDGEGHAYHAYETGEGVTVAFDVQYYVNGAWTSEEPVNVGKYNVKVLDSKTGQELMQVENGLQIIKRNITITVPDVQSQYGDADAELVFELAEGSALGQGDELSDLNIELSRRRWTIVK